MKISSAKRFVRKLENGEFTPILSVKVGFKVSEIPKEIIINYSILKVEFYYPIVRQCFKCGRLGHKGIRQPKRTNALGGERKSILTKFLP